MLVAAGVGVPVHVLLAVGVGVRVEVLVAVGLGVLVGVLVGVVAGRQALLRPVPANNAPAMIRNCRRE